MGEFKDGSFIEGGETRINSPRQIDQIEMKGEVFPSWGDLLLRNIALG
jgi:hypothetical protein